MALISLNFKPIKERKKKNRLFQTDFELEFTLLWAMLCPFAVEMFSSGFRQHLWGKGRHWTTRSKQKYVRMLHPNKTIEGLPNVRDQQRATRFLCWRQSDRNDKETTPRRHQFPQHTIKSLLVFPGDIVLRSFATCCSWVRRFKDFMFESHVNEKHAGSTLLCPSRERFSRERFVLSPLPASRADLHRLSSTLTNPSRLLPVFGTCL